MRSIHAIAPRRRSRARECGRRRDGAAGRRQRTSRAGTRCSLWNPGCGFCRALQPDLLAWERSTNETAPRLVVVSSSDADSAPVVRSGRRVRDRRDADGSARRCRRPGCVAGGRRRRRHPRAGAERSWLGTAPQLPHAADARSRLRCFCRKETVTKEIKLHGRLGALDSSQARKIAVPRRCGHQLWSAHCALADRDRSAWMLVRKGVV
jgi:hypothetical protein